MRLTSRVDATTVLADSQFLLRKALQLELRMLKRPSTQEAQLEHRYQIRLLESNLAASKAAGDKFGVLSNRRYLDSAKAQAKKIPKLHQLRQEKLDGFIAEARLLDKWVKVNIDKVDLTVASSNLSESATLTETISHTQNIIARLQQYLEEQRGRR